MVDCLNGESYSGTGAACHRVWKSWYLEFWATCACTSSHDYRRPGGAGASCTCPRPGKSTQWDKAERGEPARFEWVPLIPTRPFPSPETGVSFAVITVYVSIANNQYGQEALKAQCWECSRVSRKGDRSSLS